MTFLGRMWAGVRWVTPIERWTTLVAVAFGLSVVGWIIALIVDVTDATQAPNEVVTSFYDALQERRFEDAAELLSDDARTRWDALSQTERDTLIGELTHDYTQVDQQFLGVQNFGDNAVVGVLQVLETEVTDLRVEVLSKAGRHWRLDWPLGVANWFESVERFDPAARYQTRDTD